MIRIDEVNSVNLEVLPTLLSEYSLSELLREGTEGARNIVQASERMWTGFEDSKFLFLVGVHRPTLISEPYLWMLVGKDFAARHIRQMQFVRETLAELYAGDLAVLAEAGSAPQNKFAKHFGFKPVAFGDVYNKYRMN